MTFSVFGEIECLSTKCSNGRTDGTDGTDGTDWTGRTDGTDWMGRTGRTDWTDGLDGGGGGGGMPPRVFQGGLGPTEGGGTPWASGWNFSGSRWGG